MTSTTLNETLAFVMRGELTDNFRERLRDWWAPDFDDCDDWCCPSCSDLKALEAARAVGSFLHAFGSAKASALASISVTEQGETE